MTLQRGPRAPSGCHSHVCTHTHTHAHSPAPGQSSRGLSLTPTDPRQRRANAHSGNSQLAASSLPSLLQRPAKEVSPLLGMEPGWFLAFVIHRGQARRGSGSPSLSCPRGSPAGGSELDVSGKQTPRGPAFPSLCQLPALNHRAAAAGTRGHRKKAVDPRASPCSSPAETHRSI